MQRFTHVNKHLKEENLSKLVSSFQGCAVEVFLHTKVDNEVTTFDPNQDFPQAGDLIFKRFNALSRHISHLDMQGMPLPSKINKTELAIHEAVDELLTELEKIFNPEGQQNQRIGLIEGAEVDVINKKSPYYGHSGRIVGFETIREALYCLVRIPSFPDPQPKIIHPDHLKVRE
jgi:hypothetical protein